MGCCTSVENDWTRAGKAVLQTFPDIESLTAEITIKGSFGIPFRAVYNGQPVFVKVTRVRDYTRRVLRKASYLQDQPYILVPIDYKINQGNAVAIYPWIDGGDLVHKLTFSISDQTKHRYIKGILKAVHYLHSNALAHRDIKLENILTRDGECVLIDIDTCDRASELYFSGTGCYLPPRATIDKCMLHDQITRGDKMYWLDCYALGKTIAKILLVGAIGGEERRIWNNWVDRERAAPSAIRGLLERKKDQPFWDLVYWFCVENVTSLYETDPYLKLTDEAMAKYCSGTRDM